MPLEPVPHGIRSRAVTFLLPRATCQVPRVTFPQGLVRMASAFIRGRPGEPLSGWAGGTGPLASVLYFDEVQVRDVRRPPALARPRFLCCCHAGPVASIRAAAATPCPGYHAVRSKPSFNLSTLDLGS